MKPYKISSGKIKRARYNENYKIRRLSAIAPKGYDGDITIEELNGEKIAKFKKKYDKE